MNEYFNNYSFAGFNNPSGNMLDFTGKTGSIPKSNVVNTTTDGLNQDPDMLTQLGGLGAIAELIGSIGGLVQGFKANKLAKQTLNFQKDAFNKNFANQTKAYNTNLADTINARYTFEGKTQDQANQYVNNNRL